MTDDSPIESLFSYACTELISGCENEFQPWGCVYVRWIWHDTRACYYHSHTNYRSSVCVLSVKTLIKPPFITHELIMSVLNYNISVWVNLLCATLQLQQHKVLQNTDFRQRAKNMWCVHYRGAEIQERTLLSLQTQFAPDFRPIESQWSVILSCHVSDTFEI